MTPREIVEKYFSGGDADGEALIVEVENFGRAQYERGFNEATETCDRHVDNASREVFSRAITAAAEVAHKFVARKFGANGCCTLRERILALLPKEGAKG